MNKKTIIGIVGVLIATTLIAYGANSMVLSGVKKTEKRITVSRSYMDYWEYNNNKGVYKVEGSTAAGGDAVIGERIAHMVHNPYYRGLQPGEKVVGVNVRVPSIGNVSQSEFIESQYEETAGGADWAQYNNEQNYTGKGTQISNVNVKSVSDPTGTHPEVGVLVGVVLIDPGWCPAFNQHRPSRDIQGLQSLYHLCTRMGNRISSRTRSYSATLQSGYWYEDNKR